MMLEVGKKYDVLLNGELRSITITKGFLKTKQDGERYIYVWDDGEEEWAYLVDIKRLMDLAEDYKSKESK